MSEFTPAVIAKASTLTARPDQEVPDMIRVTSGDRVYSVHLIRTPNGAISFATCTCPHGVKKGGGHARCSHVVAALATIDPSLLD